MLYSPFFKSADSIQSIVW